MVLSLARTSMEVMSLVTTKIEEILWYMLLSNDVVLANRTKARVNAKLNYKELVKKMS